jgi:hypothetical protein
MLVIRQRTHLSICVETKWPGASLLTSASQQEHPHLTMIAAGSRLWVSLGQSNRTEVDWTMTMGHSNLCMSFCHHRKRLSNKQHVSFC